MKPNENVQESAICSDCGGSSRRDFLKKAVTVGAASLALPTVPLLRSTARAAQEKSSENYVQLLYESLTPEQRKIMHFSFDHEKRTYIANNWDVVEPEVASIGKLYSRDQQELIRLIFRNATTEDAYFRFRKQMKDDAGGFDKYTCAIFGDPGANKFEWVLTGRHLTFRVDGNSVENAAFGGPIFYGHAGERFREKPDHPGNVWWHQGKLANKVFQALDGAQREKALLPEDPDDDSSAVRLRGHEAEIPGLIGSEMSADQKALLEETLKSFLTMYRQSDVDEALECIKKNGGIDKLRMSFFKRGDIGDDGVWDRWRVEGPTFVWYFRGSPHVHVWVNLAHEVPVDQSASEDAQG